MIGAGATPRSGPPRLWGLALAASVPLGALALAVLYRFDPSRYPVYPRCLFHELTGLHCPGCGGTRALHQLLHGRLVEALRLNPLLVFALPYMGYAALSEWRRLRTGRPLPNLFASARSVWALLVVLLLFSVLRNLPIEPFSRLAP